MGEQPRVPRDSHPLRARPRETHNLEGGSGDVVAPPVRLLAHLANQTFPVVQLADLVITHRGVTAADRARCEAAIATPITWIECTDDDGYYDAKNRGFDASRGDVVVFAEVTAGPSPAGSPSSSRHLSTVRRA